MKIIKVYNEADRAEWVCLLWNSTRHTWDIAKVAKNRGEARQFRHRYNALMFQRWEARGLTFTEYFGIEAHA